MIENYKACFHTCKFITEEIKYHSKLPFNTGKLFKAIRNGNVYQTIRGYKVITKHFIVLLRYQSTKNKSFPAYPLPYRFENQTQLIMKFKASGKFFSFTKPKTIYYSRLTLTDNKEQNQ